MQELIIVTFVVFGVPAGLAATLGINLGANRKNLGELPAAVLSTLAGLGLWLAFLTLSVGDLPWEFYTSGLPALFQLVVGAAAAAGLGTALGGKYRAPKVGAVLGAMTGATALSAYLLVSAMATRS